MSSESKEEAQEAWKTTYRDLDNSALLALLPVLQDQIGRARQEVERLGGLVSSLDESTEEYRGWLEQAVSLQEQGHDVSKEISMFEEGLQSQVDFEPRQRRVYMGTFAYLVDLEKRRIWVRDVECPRRGLLPSQEDFLTEHSS